MVSCLQEQKEFAEKEKLAIEIYYRLTEKERGAVLGNEFGWREEDTAGYKKAINLLIVYDEGIQK